MAILPILIYGAPALRQKASPVTAVDGAVQRLIDDMVETMYAAPGVGLAANQVGILQRVIVVNPTEGQEPDGLVAIINPEIVHLDGVLFIDRLSPAKKTLLKRQLKKRFLDQA